jgi:alkaline phosphatase D
MTGLDRRRFLASAVALGASAAWAGARAGPSRAPWRERRDLYPQGVASGDPQSDSVILWTRRPFPAASPVARLTVEVAEDADFTRVVATAKAPVSAASDWTARVLVGGLRPRRVYWYRFTDAEGAGSRIGRTLTAPAADDQAPVRFAFVSCQNANQGAQNAYRRMIHEDRQAPADRKLGFVLHLGDFIYEIVWYPEDRPQGMYDRRLRDVARYASGEKVSDFHIPTTVADYRTVYRGYLADPDIQDARAWFPFVNMWDNHEFSWLGWQGVQIFHGQNRPAQTRKVAAMQAWFEYQPARVKKLSGPGLDTFDPPAVADAPITAFDDHGLGQEPNNLKAIASLTGYRTIAYGPHVDLIITDQHSYRSQEPTSRPECDSLNSPDFPEMFPEEAQFVLDAGRAYDGGKPPQSLRFGEVEVANFRKAEPPQTILGAEQKAWFKDQLATSKATWKVWGNTSGTLDQRADPQNIPAGIGKPWPSNGYAGGGGGDLSGTYVERAEIYDLVRDRKITGFATIAGDRHSFWAGLAAKALPPQDFEPVGIAFTTGSLSAPGMLEAIEHNFPKDHALRSLFLLDQPGQAKPLPMVNMLFRHGVKSCLEYGRSGDMAKARAASNPALSPHLSFVDMGGHGYGVVTASADALDTEFVCIPRPLERAADDDGGPLLYRVSHRARLWGPDERPVLEQRIIEGDPKFSV